MGKEPTVSHQCYQRAKQPHGTKHTNNHGRSSSSRSDSSKIYVYLHDLHTLRFNRALFSAHHPASADPHSWSRWLIRQQITLTLTLLAQHLFELFALTWRGLIGIGGCDAFCSCINCVQESGPCMALSTKLHKDGDAAIHHERVSAPF